MRRLSVFLLLVVMLIGCRGVVAGEPSLSELQAWSGKYPLEKIGNTTFWTHPVFVAEANRILGQEVFGILVNVLAVGVNTPMKRNGDILSTFVCKAHECMADSARILIDVQKNKLYVCWHESGSKEDAWLESGKKPQWIGEGGCAVSEPYELYAKYVKE